MKTFKIILAWLDWSSYCMDYNYTFPKTLCSLFWRTLFNILLLPFAYTTHLWNIFLDKNIFKEERDSNQKIGAVYGFMFHILIIGMGMGFSIKIIEEIGLNWFHMTDPILLNYIKVMGIGLISCIIIALIIGIIHELYQFLYKKYHKEIKYEEINIEPSIIKKIYLAIKDKYCPIIDWSDTRK